MGEFFGDLLFPRSHMEIVTENEKCRKEDSYRMYLELKRAKKK
jgi:hypothetical protein